MQIKEPFFAKQANENNTYLKNFITTYTLNQSSQMDALDANKNFIKI
jgi:hypothetical protein